MLTIRDDQVAVFTQVASYRFETKMIDHLKRSFPDWARRMDDSELAGFVQHGVARAEKYGITLQLGVAYYLHAMQALGKDFDSDVRYPWAHVLLPRSDLPPTEKTEKLRDAVQYHGEAIRIEGITNDPLRGTHGR